jgi:hypothetical protein
MLLQAQAPAHPDIVARLIAGYGAAVATAVFIWNVWVYRRTHSNRVKVQPCRRHANFSAGSRPTLAVAMTNKTADPVTVETVALRGLVAGSAWRPGRRKRRDLRAPFVIEPYQADNWRGLPVTLARDETVSLVFDDHDGHPGEYTIEGMVGGWCVFEIRSSDGRRFLSKPFRMKGNPRELKVLRL